MIKVLKAFIVERNASVTKQLKSLDFGNGSIYEIIGTSEDLETAMEIFKDIKPDLIFLNPEEKNLNQLQKLQNLDYIAPKLVFISEDKSKAYEAFQHKAAYFVLRPIKSSDILSAVYNVKNVLEMETALQNEKINAIDSVNKLYNNPALLSIASLDKIDLIKTEDIMYCKADGKYTEFILRNGSKIISSRNIGEYQNKLDENTFFRIHHSYLININHIEKVTKKDGYYCEFKNGEKLPIAKRRQEGFTKFINL